MEDYLRVGVITSTHGVKGEVKVYPTTDDAERFRVLKNVFIDTGKELLSCEIENVKFFKQYVILKIKNFDTIEQIEKYKSKDILVSRIDAVPLNDDEYYICDIIGSDVYEENMNKLGTLADVLQTGANDVYIVKTNDNKEILIPVIKDCIVNVDVSEKKIIVHLLPGLI